MIPKDKTFGDWLFEQRKLAGKTQFEIANASGCSKQYISNLERNWKTPISNAPIRPSIEIVDKIALELGVPASEARLAAGYAPQSYDIDQETRTLIAYIQGLPDDAREFLKAQLGALYKQYGGTGSISAPRTNSQIQQNLPPMLQRLDQLLNAIRKKAILYASESANIESLGAIIEILRRATFELNILRKNAEEERLAAADPTYIPKTYRREELSAIPLTQEQFSDSPTDEPKEFKVRSSKKKRA